MILISTSSFFAVSAAFDSTRTVAKALSASVWLSTSDCPSVEFAKTDFAVAKASFAAERALASAFLGYDDTVL